MFYKFTAAETHQLAPDCKRRVLAKTDTMMLCRLDMEEGHMGPIHTHPHEQCTYVISGKVEVVLEDGKKLLEAGDSVGFASNVPHTYRAVEDAVVLESFTPLRDDILNFGK